MENHKSNENETLLPGFICTFSRVAKYPNVRGIDAREKERGGGRTETFITFTNFVIRSNNILLLLLVVFFFGCSLYLFICLEMSANSTKDSRASFEAPKKKVSKATLMQSNQ